MTNKEISRFGQKLKEILLIEVKASQHEQYPKSLEDKFHKLMSLAKDVGASYYLGTESAYNITKLGEKCSSYGDVNTVIEAAICELVYNINDSLRTWAMINASKAASRSCLISIIAVTIAVVAAVASWLIALGSN